MKRTWKAADLWLFSGTIIFCGGGYLLLNHPSTHLHSLQTIFDQRMPLIPLFSIPYVIFVPLFWLFLLFALAKGEKFHELAWSTIVVYAVAFVVYLVFPAVVPRPNVLGTGWADLLLRFVYAHDNPYNTFPSLHVASATLLSYYVVATKRSWWWVAFFVLVVVSTLLIHQHYVADVIGGLILALGVSHFVYTQKPPASFRG